MITIPNPSPVRGEINTLVTRHGALPVLRAVLFALLSRQRRRRRPPPIYTHELPTHLRRDLGLPPQPRKLPANLPPTAGLF